MKPETSAKPRILIVDDEKENLTGFKYLFDDDYDVFTAESAAEAEDILLENSIQVVISDQRMPEKTGVEFLQEVLRKYPDTIRMILTGYSDFIAIINAINKGHIYYYFTKPWNESEMRMIIENALEAIELEKALKQSETCLHQLSDNVKEIFWLYAVDWREIFYVSSAYQTIFQSDPNELFETPLKWLAAVHAEDLDQVTAFMDKTNADLEAKLTFPEFRIVSPDNTVRWIQFKVFPVKNQFEKTYRFACLMEDITESKQTMEMLIQSEKIMSMGGLAAGLAHELNNPLSIIIQGIQIIKKRLLSDARSTKDTANISPADLKSYLEKKGIFKLLDNVGESGLRAAKIITDMLSFSRKSDSSKEEVSISQLLENMISMARADYEAKTQFNFDQIEIIKEIDENLPPLSCNEIEIGQVVLNLIRNAAQAIASQESTSDPMITIRARSVDNAVIIEIQDNGPGMDESIQKRIFEPFFTTKKKGEGTGLGLSISNKIITMNHGGSITCESLPGSGTRFSIVLPYK